MFAIDFWRFEASLKSQNHEIAKSQNVLVIFTYFCPRLLQIIQIINNG